MQSAKLSVRMIVGAMFMLVSLGAYSAAIQWHSYSSSVFSEAKKQHKYVLLYAYSPTCSYCRSMSTQTLIDPAIVSLVNQGFIAVKLDITTSPAIANRYDISGVPTVLILSTDHSVLKTIYGYEDPSDFSDKLGSVN